MFTFASVNDVCLLDFDGSTIASGHLDNNLRFWDARSGNCVKEVTGIHMGQITSVCPSTDGSQILTNSRDNTLRILDMRTYETVSVLHADGYKTGTNWSKACFRYAISLALCLLLIYSRGIAVRGIDTSFLFVLCRCLVARMVSMWYLEVRMARCTIGQHGRVLWRRRSRSNRARLWGFRGSTAQLSVPRRTRLLSSGEQLPVALPSMRSRRGRHHHLCSKTIQEEVNCFLLCGPCFVVKEENKHLFLFGFFPEE